MMDLERYTANVAQVLPRLSHAQLAVLCDFVAVECVNRGVVGCAAASSVARNLRERARQELLGPKAIHSDDCSAIPPS